MTAPDPGLTDLITMHRQEKKWFEFTWETVGLLTSSTGSVAWTKCECGVAMELADHPAHVALAVEQHTNRRIAELEERIAAAQSLCHDTGRYNAARQKHWNIRVFACDVLAALKGRAALEGEQR